MNNLRNEVYVHTTADVSPDSKIGAGTKIWNFAQIRENTQIGENCIVSKDSYIDTGVIIGNNVKIQNGVSLYKGIKVEDDVFLGPHCVFTNDLQPRSFTQNWNITNTILRKGCSIGANATIVCGNVVGPYAMVAAGSVVTQDVAPFSLVMGNPARMIGMVCKNGHRMQQVNKFDEKLKFYCKPCNEEITFDLKMKTQSLGTLEYDNINIEGNIE
tara:strand:+ start:202 stop:843 length:642 start_codon:yes stop_codon:yes gene_type:complete